MLKMQTLLCDGNQYVGGYSNPDLRLHGVLACSEEHFDAQMLLDPLEEQLHPTYAGAGSVNAGDTDRQSTPA